jgi:hypothetical protein
MLSVFAAALFAAQSMPVVEPAPAVLSGNTATTGLLLADCCVIKALTPVRLKISSPLSSNTVATGQTFAFTLSEAISLDDGRSIPAGTPGQGEVVHATKSGMAGKGGELVLAARYLEFEGLRIPLRSMRFGAVGKDQTGTANAISIGTAVVAPLAGLFALAITGGEVRLPAGAVAEAKVSADTRIVRGRVAEPMHSPVTSINKGNLQ